MTKKEWEKIKEEEINIWEDGSTREKDSFLSWWVKYGMIASSICMIFHSNEEGTREECYDCPIYSGKDWICNMNWNELSCMLNLVFRFKQQFDEKLYVKCKKLTLAMLSDIKKIEYKEEWKDIPKERKRYQ